jgi:phosphoribosylglycinamide formyltransferase 1
MHRIAIFASGSGSNAENIAQFFAGSELAAVELILTNNPEAGVTERAVRLGIPCEIFNRYQFYDSDHIPKILTQYKISFLVLAGFLWLVPQNILKIWSGRIVNIHPALLPKYGGKGMYGMNVHNAVYQNGDRESGITIHFVNARYDEGNQLFQAVCDLDEYDTPDSIAMKVHVLEYQYYPQVIKELLEKIPDNHPANPDPAI